MDNPNEVYGAHSFQEARMNAVERSRLWNQGYVILRRGERRWVVVPEGMQARFERKGWVSCGRAMEGFYDRTPSEGIPYVGNWYEVVQDAAIETFRWQVAFTVATRDGEHLSIPSSHFAQMAQAGWRELLEVQPKGTGAPIVDRRKPDER